MSVQIDIPTTPKQDVKLQRLLDMTNQQRVLAGLPPYADFNAYAKDYLIDNVKGWVKSVQETDPDDVKQAYIDADDAVQDQVLVLLGLKS